MKRVGVLALSLGALLLRAGEARADLPCVWGYINDTHGPLAGVSVMVNNISVATGKDGSFILCPPPMPQLGPKSHLIVHAKDGRGWDFPVDVEVGGSYLGNFLLDPAALAIVDSCTDAQTPMGRLVQQILAVRLEDTLPREQGVLQTEPLGAPQADQGIDFVPGDAQHGGTCGLYALQMVTDHWNRVTEGRAPTRLALNPWQVAAAESTNATPSSITLANFWEEEHTWWPPARLPPSYADDLISFARARMKICCGAAAGDLAQIAQDVGYHAVQQDPGLGQLHRLTAAGYPVLVAVTLDNNGNPEPTGGAHWVVVEGFWTDPATGKEYVILKHGWSNSDFVWPEADFQKAMIHTPTVVIWPRGIAPPP